MPHTSLAHVYTGSFDRRSFIKSAALGCIGLGLIGTIASVHDADASEATLAALDGAQAEYEAAMAELQSIGLQLEQAEYQVGQCEYELAQTQEQIKEIEGIISQRQAELAEAQDVLASRIAANYRLGNTDALNLILDAADFDDFVSRIYYAGKVSDADAAAIQVVKDIKADLEQQENALLAVRAEQEVLLEEQQQYAAQLAETEAYYQSYVGSLSAEVQQLMAQAQAEIAAQQQAEYEAYMAQQAAQTEIITYEVYDEQTGEVYYVEEEVPVESSGGYDDGGYYGGTGNHDGSVVGIAASMIGVPYVWGGTSPGGFDCSGLTSYCYASAGYGIGRTTYAQIAQIQSLGNWKTSMDQLVPGDLVFPHDGHVGIYVGGGTMIHAPYPGTTVQYSEVYAFMGGGSPI